MDRPDHSSSERELLWADAEERLRAEVVDAPPSAEDDAFDVPLASDPGDRDRDRDLDLDEDRT